VANEFPYNRICVVGTSAAGKSTLARELAARLNYQRIELDALYHGPGWQPASRDEFEARVSAATDVPCWVCDGNYHFTMRHLLRADLVIFLNYPFRIVLWRVIKRTLRRLITNEELWNGNRENWRMTFSKESIVWWVVKTHHRRKREMPRIMSALEAISLVFHHPRELRKWLRDL
jgi:adenylate kinase family enzyme